LEKVADSIGFDHLFESPSVISMIIQGLVLSLELFIRLLFASNIASQIAVHTKLNVGGNSHKLNCSNLETTDEF